MRKFADMACYGRRIKLSQMEKFKDWSVYFDATKISE